MTSDMIQGQSRNRELVLPPNTYPFVLGKKIVIPGPPLLFLCGLSHFAIHSSLGQLLPNGSDHQDLI